MISTLKHLAYTLKIEVEEFDNIINRIDDFYYEKKEPKKKNGKPRLLADGSIEYRIIHPSKGRLKEIQKRINRSVLSLFPMPEYAFGAVKGRDNVLHAKFHQGNKHFFNTDLKNFYPSMYASVKLTTVGRFKLTSACRFKLTTLGRCKLTT
ncbi:MAG: hypothetical protein ACKOXB_08980 [Flavobacteriales bacterium]